MIFEEYVLNSGSSKGPINDSDSMDMPAATALVVDEVTDTLSQSKKELGSKVGSHKAPQPTQSSVSKSPKASMSKK